MKNTIITSTKKAKANEWTTLALITLAVPAITLAGVSQVNAANVNHTGTNVNQNSYIDLDEYDFTDFEDEMDENPYPHILTDNEWETLSMAQIDAKLKAGGEAVIGDSQDPLYHLTPAQIEALTETQWNEIDTQYEALYGSEIFADEDSELSEATDLESFLSSLELDTLSMAQIDAELTAAGYEAIGNETDPLYNLTPQQIEALTDAQWDEINQTYANLADEEDLDFMDEIDDTEFLSEEDSLKVVISQDDWQVLSMAQIDAKLKAAGYETIGDSQDPLYNLTPAQIDALTDAQWEKIDAQYDKMHN